MKTLLKDMPEHMERIDGNFALIDKIKDCLIENQQTYYDDDSEDAEEVQALNAEDFNNTAELIIKELTEFVNQNYEWKGVKS